jgi:hypothetical protein
MSMIGKLRRVSEFELARYKKNPRELVRLLAAGPLQLDPQLYEQMRETLQRSPSVQQMMEMAKQGKRPSGPEQVELQKNMMQLLKQALAVQKASPAKPSGGGPPAENPAAEELDLHKSWHCLHFLFTGKVDGSDGTPLGEAILGGAEIGGEAADTGYGPPRGLSPSQVRDVSAALATFPIETKVKEFDAEAADQAGVYAAHHGQQELLDYFRQLREFYADAARKGNAVLLWIA